MERTELIMSDKFIFEFEEGDASLTRYQYQQHEIIPGCVQIRKITINKTNADGMRILSWGPDRALQQLLSYMALWDAKLTCPSGTPEVLYKEVSVIGVTSPPLTDLNR
jgi:hypothetical protein